MNKNQFYYQLTFITKSVFVIWIVHCATRGENKLFLARVDRDECWKHLTRDLTPFSYLTGFRVEIDISYHFHKIRLKCEIFFPTYRREKGTISCLSWENTITKANFWILKRKMPIPIIFDVVACSMKLWMRTRKYFFQLHFSAYC